MTPTQPTFPFSLLDYGLAVTVLIALVVVVYLFIKFLNNHMSGVTKVLDDLVQTTRGMRDEFFRLSSEERDTAAGLTRLTDEVRRVNFQVQSHQSTYQHDRRLVDDRAEEEEK